MAPKKRVSFADESGEDLLTIIEPKTESRAELTNETSPDDQKADEIASAIDDVKGAKLKEKATKLKRFLDRLKPSASKSIWTIDFMQPIPYVMLLQQLAAQSIALERAVVKHSLNMLVGWIRVNVSFAETTVFVRYTMDGWHTSREREATYEGRAPTSGSDVYVFQIDLHDATMGRVEFEVCCTFGFDDDVMQSCDDNWGRSYIVSKQVTSARGKGAEDNALPRRWSFTQ